MKKFTDVDESLFRHYNEATPGTLFTEEPFEFHCQFAGKRLVVSIPAGYTFTDKHIPFGLQSIVGTRSLYPQAAAVMQALYCEKLISINGCQLYCNDAQRDAAIESMMFLLLDRKQARVIASKLIDYNRSVKNNTRNPSYGRDAITRIKDSLIKDRSCQHV